MPNNRKVGDTLYWVNSRIKYDKRVVAIEKVGRKYLTLSNGQRVSVENLNSDSGCCFESKQHWEAVVRRTDVWAEFRQQVGYSWPPPEVTTEDILKAAEILRMKVKNADA